jgi:hypothetical protein
MTVSSVNSTVTYTGSGNTGPFSIPFYFASTSELIVTKTSSAGIETTLASPGDYAASGAGSDTGAITLTTALPVGETLTISRMTTRTQTLDLVRSFIDPERMESALDRLARSGIDLWREVGRSLRLYEDDVSGSGAWDAENNKISRLTPGVASTDAATKGQVDSIAGSADAAAASAAAAAASAAAAAASAESIEDVISGSVASFEGRTGVVVSQAGDYTASEITNVPSGNLSAANVQAALNELQADIDGRQPLDAELTALAGLVSSANKLAYYTGSGTAALTDLTAFARNLLDDADAATARATLGLTIGTNVQGWDTDLDHYAANVSPFFKTLIDDVDAAAARTTLGLGTAATSAASSFQAADPTLAALASYNTNGILAQTAADTFVGRTITPGSGITISNGDGVAGNPSIAMDINGLLNRTSWGPGDKIPIYQAGVGIRKIDYADIPAGGGGLSAAYANVTDGTNSAAAVASDTLKFRVGTGLTVTVGNNDLTHGDNVLFSLDSKLSNLASVTGASDTLPYMTGASTWGTTALSGFARTLLDDTDSSAARTTLGLNIGVNVQAYDVELAALSGLTSAANKLPYFTGSGTAATTDLSPFARGLLDDTDVGTARTTLELTNALVFDTRALAIAATIPADVDSFRTLGYSAVGDGGGARYIRSASGPASTFGRWRFQSADGAWWRLDEPEPDVMMFGALGDATDGGTIGTDDSEAFSDGIEYLKTIYGGGTLRIHKRHIIDDSSIDIKSGVHLKGQQARPGLLENLTDSYDDTHSVIYINPAHNLTVRPTSSVSNLILIRKGLITPYANEAAAIADKANFSGTAILAVGQCRIENILALGFGRAVDTAVAGGRFDFVGVWFDCTHGIRIIGSGDITVCDRCHGIPFLTTNRGYAASTMVRTGIAFESNPTNDWGQYRNCFCIGWSTGFYTNGTGSGSYTFVNCGVDWYPGEPGAVVGFYVGAAVGESVFLGCQTIMPIAWHIENGLSAGTGGVTKLIGCTSWGMVTDHVRVTTGRAIVSGCSFRNGTYGVIAESTAGPVTVIGCEFDTVTTPTSIHATPLANSLLFGNTRFAGSTDPTTRFRLTSGGVIAWDGSDVSITHSANLLSFSGASVGYIFDSMVRADKSGDVPLIRTNRLDAHGVAAVGRHDFIGKDSASNDHSYAQIDVVCDDNTNTSEDGHIRFAASLAGTLTNGLWVYGNGAVVAPEVATPAGGTTGRGLRFGTTANFGVFFGSGAPTLSAAQGSLYLRSDGSSTSTRLYVNTNGSTGWANFTSSS